MLPKYSTVDWAEFVNRLLDPLALEASKRDLGVFCLKTETGDDPGRGRGRGRLLALLVLDRGRGSSRFPLDSLGSRAWLVSLPRGEAASAAAKSSNLFFSSFFSFAFSSAYSVTKMAIALFKSGTSMNWEEKARHDETMHG